MTRRWTETAVIDRHALLFIDGMWRYVEFAEPGLPGPGR
jgi:hypothetical protein